MGTRARPPGSRSQEVRRGLAQTRHHVESWSHEGAEGRVRSERGPARRGRARASPSVQALLLCCAAGQTPSSSEPSRALPPLQERDGGAGLLLVTTGPLPTCSGQQSRSRTSALLTLSTPLQPAVHTRLQCCSLRCALRMSTHGSPSCCCVRTPSPRTEDGPGRWSPAPAWRESDGSPVCGLSLLAPTRGPGGEGGVSVLTSSEWAWLVPGGGWAAWLPYSQRAAGVGFWRRPSVRQPGGCSVAPWRAWRSRAVQGGSRGGGGGRWWRLPPRPPGLQVGHKPSWT